MYDSSCLEGSNQYEVFLGGDTSVVDIRTASESSRRLLLVKDSFANSLLPYLALSYREIYVFDPRYNRDSLRQFAADCGADEILVLYQTANFAQDANIGLLAL